MTDAKSKRMREYANGPSMSEINILSTGAIIPRIQSKRISRSNNTG